MRISRRMGPAWPEIDRESRHWRYGDFLFRGGQNNTNQREWTSTLVHSDLRMTNVTGQRVPQEVPWQLGPLRS